MKVFIPIICAIFLIFGATSCTPFLVGGAAAGGAYAGYKLHEEGYRIDLTKAVETPKESKQDTNPK